MTAPTEHVASSPGARTTPSRRGPDGPHVDTEEDRELRRIAVLVRLDALRHRRATVHPRPPLA